MKNILDKIKQSCFNEHPYICSGIAIISLCSIILTVRNNKESSLMKAEFKLNDMIKLEVENIIKPLMENYNQQVSKMIEISTTATRIIIRSREHLLKQKLDLEIPKKDIQYLDELKEKFTELQNQLNILKGIPLKEIPIVNPQYSRQQIAEKRLEKFGLKDNNIQEFPCHSSYNISDSYEIVDILNQVINP